MQAEAFGVAIAVGTVLYAMFSVLFRDRLSPAPKVKPL